MNVSKNITYREAIYSETANRKGMDNTPDDEQFENMQFVAEMIFQKVRRHFGVPIQVNSFFRSPAVNRAVGGSRTSQHCTGQAIDLDAIPGTGVTNKMIFDYIKDNLEFDQLINEYNYSWVHVSFKKNGNNRMQILKIG